MIADVKIPLRATAWVPGQLHGLRVPAALRDSGSGEEFANRRGNLGSVRLQREVTGLEKPDAVRR